MECWRVEDVVPHFDGLLPVASGLIERHADRGEFHPVSVIRQVGECLADAVDASLCSAVSTFVSLVATDLDPAKAVGDHSQKERLDDVVQRGRLAIQGKPICESAESVARPLVGRRISKSSEFVGES